MYFGKDLSDEFHKLTKSGEYQEVELITKLQDAFINLANSNYHYALDIIHGNRSMVDFQYNANWATDIHMGVVCRCELSDMLFIVFSEADDQIRLMYMQNKKGKTSRKFKADLGQLCLLKNRCEIISPRLPACAFGDRRILQDALLPSVGSYGVFYKDNNATDMAYYPATNISPITVIARKSDRIVQFNRTRFGQTENIGYYKESQGEKTLRDFADALIDMEIGTPIMRGDPTYDAVLSFLCDKIPRFRETRFITEWDRVRHDVAPDYSGIPFACVINADVIRG